MEAFERLVVAILVGFLIGLDRERAEVRKARKLFAGVRTFPLIALAGAVPMLLVEIAGPALLVASFVGVAAGVEVVAGVVVERPGRDHVPGRGEDGVLHGDEGFEGSAS